MASQENCRTKGAWFSCAALVVLLTGALVGCDSGDGSGQAETSPPAVTESASSSPAPTLAPAVYKPADATGPAQNVPIPVLPEVAETETKEGLEAFAKYWFELLSYGYETGDVGPISAITGLNCTLCEESKQVQTGWYEDGRWLGGGKVTTPSLSTNFRTGADGNYQVAIQVVQEPISYYNSDGSLDSVDPQATDTGSLMLAIYRDGAWFVNTIEPING